MKSENKGIIGIIAVVIILIALVSSCVGDGGGSGSSSDKNKCSYCNKKATHSVGSYRYCDKHWRDMLNYSKD